MSVLHEELCSLRRDLRPEVWRDCLEHNVRKHPIRTLVHEDPFTRHAFEKPRGYAGDAELIDYLYGEREFCEKTSPLGVAVGDFMRAQPSARSVRHRRDLLARKIDEVAEETPGARILSVACGHLREAQCSKAVLENRIGELIALDQDQDSLEMITREQGEHAVRTVSSSVRSLLNGKVSFSELDYVYSAGLYDYLSQKVATRLTEVMFDMLKPGGRLLVANFADHPPETGYMEGFMDWWLIHRSEAEVNALTGEIPPGGIAQKSVFWDDDRNVIYLEVKKA